MWLSPNGRWQVPKLWKHTLNLKPARWPDYKRFVDLCCVTTMPFHGGPCWTVGNDIAFIGYNFCYWNNRQRNLLFPEHLGLRKNIDLKWLNQNFRCLNRVMVRPAYRGQGIATQLIRQTLPLVNVPYIECLTFSELIESLLLRNGFAAHENAVQDTCRYYLWRNPNFCKI